MSNSPLVVYTKISPNKNSPRNHAIDTITIHHCAGNLTVETIGNVFANKSKQASSNYGIGSDGRVGMYVEEKDRSWCSCSGSNDHRAITIEVANCTGAPDWKVSDQAYATLIDLVTDICQRNGISKLVWSDNKSDRVNHKNGCNMTIHSDFASTTCIPVDSEVLTKSGWVKLEDVQIGDEIACADLDNLNISFEEVYDKVEPHQQDTYTNNGLTATKDHRMVYRIQKNTNNRIDFFNNLLKGNNQIYIPLAGYSKFDGMSFSDEMLQFLIAVQADGHYMYENNTVGDKRYYGVEFHLSKERKIEHIIELIESLNFEYRWTHNSDGSSRVRIYNQNDINIVNDICEKYLEDKHFTWKWLNLSPSQASLFLSELLVWDGCVAANKYSSKVRINLDIVNAIAALNGVGSKVIGDDVIFRETPYTTLSHETKRNTKQSGSRRTLVSCVSVKTGIFLMRQNGKTYITGNCPGPYLKGKMADIASKVNANLAPAPAPAPTPTPTTDGATKFVTNLYVNALNRQPDEAGLNNWVNQLTSKKTGGANVAQGIVFSQECINRKLSNDAWVTMLYPAVLGRPADAPGKKNWVNQLNAGVSREQVFYNFVTTPEFANYCKSCEISVGEIAAPIITSAKPAITPTVPQVSGPVSSTAIRAGDTVKISPSAKYYNGTAMPKWVKNLTWKVNSVSGNRAVLGKSSNGAYNINSPISTAYLTKI